MRDRVLVVELEPTHYKTDLWNAVAETSNIDVNVIYTERRNWSPDGGHDYQRFPPDQYEMVVLGGKGFDGALRSAASVLAQCHKMAPALIYVAGYVHIQTVAAILYASLTGKRFVVHADVFNNAMPGGRLALLKLAVRQILRRLIFARSEAVLVCGRAGMESAKAAGCSEHKIVDFPYCVSLSRIQTDLPKGIPEECSQDLSSAAQIVFFSGRMIPRKGLPTLLEAMAQLKDTSSWVLWIEGEGPERGAYVQLAKRLGISDRCRFLGFCQYDLHSWLIRSSDIVVVPSIEDTWGIVVDEGLQLGKAVISSDATGSGLDRIVDGLNGFILPAGMPIELAKTMRALLEDAKLRKQIGAAAAAGDRNTGPADNAARLVEMVRINP